MFCCMRVQVDEMLEIGVDTVLELLVLIECCHIQMITTFLQFNKALQNWKHYFETINYRLVGK